MTRTGDGLAADRRRAVERFLDDALGHLRGRSRLVVHRDTDLVRGGGVRTPLSFHETDGGMELRYNVDRLWCTHGGG